MKKISMKKISMKKISMKKISVDNVKDGMAVAVDIMDASGRILLPKGTVLTEEIIQTLKRRSIGEVVIDTGASELKTYTCQEIERAECMVRDTVMLRFYEKTIQQDHEGFV